MRQQCCVSILDDNKKKYREGGGKLFEEWCSDNILLLNMDKTKEMGIHLEWPVHILLYIMDTCFRTCSTHQVCGGSRSYQSHIHTYSTLKKAH